MSIIVNIKLFVVSSITFIRNKSRIGIAINLCGPLGLSPWKIEGELSSVDGAVGYT